MQVLGKQVAAGGRLEAEVAPETANQPLPDNGIVGRPTAEVQKIK